MSYRKIWLSKRPEWIVLACTAVALFFLPSRLQRETLRQFAQPLVIQTSKTSPPRVAFEEAIDRTTAPDVWFEESPNGSSRVNLNELVARDSAIKGVKAVQYKKLVLAPMQVPRDQAMESIDRQNWLETLPRQQQSRLRQADLHSGTLEQDWSLPSTRDLYEEKIQEIESQTDVEKAQNVYVATQSTSGGWMTPQMMHQNVGVRVVGAPDDPPETKAHSLVNDLAGPNGKFLVQGNLDLNKDTAMGPDRHIEVHWSDDGVVQETGSVDVVKGRYSIWLPSRSGTVLAQLIDRNGSEIGRGQYRIGANLTPAQLAQAAIAILPSNQVASNFFSFSKPDPQPGKSASAQTYASNFSRTPQAKVLISATGEEVMTNEDGQLRVEGIAPGSWTFLRTEAKGYYPSLHLAAAGEEKPMPLFSEKMMTALSEIAQDQLGPGPGGDTGAIIWGQVLQNGKGLDGVQVEIEGMPEAKPLYFFSGVLIPDRDAKATSSGGYFAFVDLPPGFHSLRVKRGDLQVGFANVEVDQGTVSPVQVSADVLSEDVPVKVYDAFTGVAQSAEAEFQHLPEAVQINGFAQIPVPHQQTLSIVEVTPDDPAYLPTMHVFSTDEDHVHLPLIRADWLQGLMSHQRINPSPEAGTIIGFVPGDDYEIDLPHAPDFDREQIVYFDAQGMPVEKGTAGGGFIVFNAPPGSHAVALLPKKSDALHTRIIPVDPGTINVLKYDF